MVRSLAPSRELRVQALRQPVSTSSSLLKVIITSGVCAVFEDKRPRNAAKAMGELVAVMVLHSGVF